MSEVEHNPQFRYDCDNCKFNWNCGLPCGCNIRNPKSPTPEIVKVARLKSFLEYDGRFITDRDSLDRYVEDIWEDDSRFIKRIESNGKVICTKCMAWSWLRDADSFKCDCKG